jgi:hypothetical protein
MYGQNTKLGFWQVQEIYVLSHAASYSVGTTGSFLGDKATGVYYLRRSRMCGATTLLLPHAFMKCI